MSKTFNMVCGGGGGGVHLQSIAITAPPVKTKYVTGETFDPAGMAVTATYTNGATLIATGWAVEPAGPLPEGLTAVMVRYTEGGVSATACQPIKVRSMSYLYGFDINSADSNPATRVNYPDDVDNFGFAPAKMNFDTSTFSHGDWPSTPGAEFMPRPCMLRFDGTVAYYLDPDDYTKKEDGTPSDVANISFAGNAMIEWPKIFTKRWEINGIYHFRCSDVKVDEEYECWCNYDRLDNEIPHFYTPIFFGSKDSSNRLRSISGQPNMVGTTAQQEIDAAKLNGADIWYTEVLADRKLIEDLITMMFKSTDLQVTAGYGHCKSSNSGPIVTGTMNATGLFWGSNDGISGVKIFGMENLWGNYLRRIAGWMLVSNEHKVKLTRGRKDGTIVDDYNIDGAGYLSTGARITTNGYISSMKTEPYGRLPIVAVGSSTTNEADYVSQSSGIQYALAGWGWNDDRGCGPFGVNFGNTAYDSAVYVGASLSCKPLAVIQTQA